MNERIKQLAEQANGFFHPRWDGREGSVEFQADNLEKFAQLIIEECGKFLDEKSDHDNFVAKVAPLLAKPKT